jgi:hypothetical protein
MSKNLDSRPASATQKLHPLVYRAMVGLALWLIVSIWAFKGGLYTDYLFMVVSGLIFFATLIPAALWWTRHRHKPPSGEHESFRRWETEDFATWQGRLSGREAATQILLPIAAVAFGMMIFAIIEHLVV